MNMEKKEYIEELIRKYREATATEAEEQELKDLLHGGYAADFPDEAAIFVAMDEAKANLQYPAGLDAKLDSLIGSLERKEKRMNLRRRIILFAASAAAIFIAVVCMMKLQEPETGPRSSNIYVVTNPHEAKKLLETVNESYALLSERCRAAVAETDSILNSNVKNNIKQQR